MGRYARLLAVPVPQTEPLNALQVKNNAGGFVFALSDMKRLERFLILGSDSQTYYQKARALTRENAACVERCWTEDPAGTVCAIADISHAGRAPKNDAAIFALALGTLNQDVSIRQLAFTAVPAVCRTSTHLFQFVDTCRTLKRGWGRAMKRAVARWYESKTADQLGYQAIKYRSRENYTHKRLLQSAHPKADSPQKAELYNWICGKKHDFDNLPVQVRAHINAMKEDTPEFGLLSIIGSYSLPWEAIPTEATKNPDVWTAMLPDMGLTAMIRNLGKMTAIGTLTPLTENTALVADRLFDERNLQDARIHPFSILQALAVYRSGHGVRGELSWEPVQTIVDALDDAFYKSFKTVEPSGKRILIGLDVSGSMSSPLMGSAITVAEGAAAMAMVTMRAEKNWEVFGFAGGFTDLKLSAKMALPEVLEKTSLSNFGTTDCSLPMLYALNKGLKVDVFCVYTDNETYQGRVHPSIALQDYRNKTGINAKLIVVGMTSTGFSIADPDDAGMLDICGWDSSAPALISDFIRG